MRRQIFIALAVLTVALMVRTAYIVHAQTATAAELRTQLSSRYDIVALQQGIALVPKAANPRVQIFDEQTINLYAFRYTQRKQMNEVLEVRRLAAEAFPESASAAYQLGISASDAGQPVESREALMRALKLLESAAMPQERQEAMRKEIRSRLDGSR